MDDVPSSVTAPATRGRTKSSPARPPHAKKVPTLKILSNHVAGADIDGKAVDPTWAAALKQAATHPNVYCKVSGLFQQSHRRPSIRTPSGKTHPSIMRPTGSG